MMGVTAKNLTVRFKNGTTAVDHVNFQMDHGIYGLLGENGAGKTTLMRVLTTILEPTQGTVSLDGIEYCEKNYGKIRKRIGYLPQELNLYPDLTVRECLEYLAATCSQLAVMRKGRFLYEGSVIRLLNQARGHVWLCETDSEETARKLEQRVRVASRQYTERGMSMKFVGDESPEGGKIRCRPVEVTLEDAYLYLMNREE